MSGQGEALTAEQARVDVRAALMKVHHLSKPSQANPWIDAIEAAAARESLPSVEEMAAALNVIGDGPDGCDFAGGEGPDHHSDEFAEAVLTALRAARASDGGR